MIDYSCNTEGVQNLCMNNGWEGAHLVKEELRGSFALRNSACKHFWIFPYHQPHRALFSLRSNATSRNWYSVFRRMPRCLACKVNRPDLTL